MDAGIGTMRPVGLGRAGDAAGGALLWAWRAVLGALGLMVPALAWMAAGGRLYKAGSGIGYDMGLAGGLLMLSLLIYPLRKRMRFLDRLGSMGGWFRYHMTAGILGPTLILFHSTFHIGSMNARVALYAMLLVVFSGVVGRFLYRRVHRGLYGRQLCLADAQGELAESMERLGAVYSLLADIEPRLQGFHRHAFTTPAGLPGRVWHFIALRAASRRLALSIQHDVRKVLSRLVKEGGLTRGEGKAHYLLAKQQTDRYLSAIVSVSQFKQWERLFSLWHAVHIPFLYLLLISGVIHVIAVHMY